MHFVRKTALVLITPIFSFLLLAAAFDMGVIRVVSQPSNVKQVLANSGVYGTAVDSLLNQDKQISSDGNASGDDISLNDPIIRSAANSVITPQFLQSNTESAIDSIYAWLDGKTSTPDFSIDLSGLKNQFAAAVSKSVETRAASLPACTATTLPSSFDALSASCLPPGVTPAAAASEVQGDILGGKGFLDSTVITANSIKSKNQQPIFSSQLKNAPKRYRQLKETPIVLSAAALLIAVAIVFLSSSRRKGLRHVGIILLVVGLLVMAFAWGSNREVNQVVPKIKLSDSVLQTDVHKIIPQITQKIDHNYWILGGTYSLLGLLTIAASLLWKGKEKDSKDKDDLEGEGKTAEDRIDLKESDKVIPLATDQPKPKPKAKTQAQPAAEPPVKKTIEVK